MAARPRSPTQDVQSLHYSSGAALRSLIAQRVTVLIAIATASFSPVSAALRALLLCAGLKTRRTKGWSPKTRDR